ncbi:MAG: hypothetical protein V7776_05115 [Halopseudomonas aestusnigri]
MITKVLLIPFLAISFVGGCTIINEKIASDYELEYIKSYCEPTDGSLVGAETGIQIALDAKREDLDSVKADLTLKKYKKLSATLAGYTAEAQQIATTANIACKNAAICLYRNEDQKVCNSESDRYDRRMADISVLMTEIKKIKPN